MAADAVLLTTLYVVPAYRGTGLGRLLVQTVAKDLLQRDVHAIEAFGELRRPRGLPDPGRLPARRRVQDRPRRTPRHPRLRLDLRSTVTWREDVEVALERLLGAIATTTPARSPPCGMITFTSGFWASRGLQPS